MSRSGGITESAVLADADGRGSRDSDVWRQNSIVIAPSFWKAMALWLLLVVLAIANGTLREKVLVPALGSTVAMQISGVTLAVAIFLVSWFTLPWHGRLSPSGYWLIGFFWLFMTMMFEFGFGHFIARKSWPELLDAYNVARGNLWIVVLLAVLLSPWLGAKLRGSG